MRRRQLTRRQRLVLATLALGGVAVLGAGAAAFLRRAPEPYNTAAAAEGITSDLERAVPADHPKVAFREVSAESGLVFRHFSGARSTQLPEDMGSGAAWGDYDNDGDDDLFLVNVAGPLTLSEADRSRSAASCALFRNEGGTFADATAASGLALRITGMAAAWGDFDGDGWLDLVVTSYPRLHLFRNRRDGTFEDVTEAAGLGRLRGFWAGASWADYDRDGDLDLYVCGYVRYRFDPADRDRVSLQYRGEVPFTLNPSSYPPEPNLLLRNDGPRGFAEVAAQAGVANPSGRSLSAAWCDLDADGWLDLYVANDISDNALFRNRGDGTFEDVSHATAVADYRGAMGLGIGDWDGDGDFDIFVTHWIAQENALYSNARFLPSRQEPAGLLFVDVADQYGLGQIALDYIGWGTSFFDYDHDGRLDLLVVNGSTFQDERAPERLVPMRHLLFWNRGAPDGFFEVGAVSGEIFLRATVGRGAAFADYDRDGDMDAVVVNHGDRAWLLRNDGGNRRHWLQVRAAGRRLRFGEGALVSVTARGVTRIQQIGSQPSYLSQNALMAHFGLGDADTVDRVRVVFLDGTVVEREAVPADQVLVVREP